MIPHMMDQFRQSLNGPAASDDVAGLIAELRDGVPRVPEDRREYIGEPDWDAADRQMERAADALETQAAKYADLLEGFREANNGWKAANARANAELARMREALTVADGIIKAGQVIRQTSTSPKRNEYARGMVEAAKELRAALKGGAA